jgi:phosphatidylserine decarboxylase
MGPEKSEPKYQWPETQRFTTLPLAAEGVPILAAAAFITLVLALLELTIPALIGLAAAVFLGFFFRDPDRVVPRDEKAVVSPADGRVLAAEIIADGGGFYEGKCLKISIFMSIFNVHVNRIPASATVRRIEYHPGRFFSANLDKASAENERNAVFMETEDGQRFSTVQIAGLVARRIICRIQPGDSVLRGGRFGLICFGSRLDVYLPPEVESAVRKGQKVQAGTSIIGYFP